MASNYSVRVRVRACAWYVRVRVRERGLCVVCVWCAWCVWCVCARMRGVCARASVVCVCARVYVVCVRARVWCVRVCVRIRNRKGYSRVNNFTSAKLSIFVALSDITHLYIPLVFTFIEIVNSFLFRIVEYSTSPFPGFDHFPNIASGDPNAAHVNVTDETLTFTMGAGFFENPSCLVRSCIYFRALPV